jgi:hypothetical protein
MARVEGVGGMTTFELALLVIAFLSVLVIADAVWVLVKGPDPDLLSDFPPDDTMCKCGIRGGTAHHIHASWTERKPR